jgi:hypothetical protein
LKAFAVAESEKLPKSCTHWADPFLITLVIAASFLYGRTLSLSSAHLAVIIASAVTILVCLLEFFRAPWRAQPRPKVAAKTVLSRALIKWIGTQLGFAVALFGWWLLAEYRRPYYAPFFETLSWLGIAFPLITAMCIFYTEWRVGPEDEKNHHMGLVALGRWSKVNWTLVRDDLLSWVIKWFFLPINFCELVYAAERFRTVGPSVFDMPFTSLQGIIMGALYGFIIASIIPGYLFSARLFNTQVRKIDFSWLGWLVTMCCYSPFVNSFFNRWFDYNPQQLTAGSMQPWITYTQDFTPLLYLVGGAIIFLEVMHYWGEAIFGIRASNISHRGIITNGPLRFCKHPVYLSKCLAWLLIWMPFMIGGGIIENFRLTLLWFCVSGIYLMRGWVEERLLASDPVYVAYGRWIDRHGLFAWAGKLVPPLSFEWRYERWKAKGYF